MIRVLLLVQGWCNELEGSRDEGFVRLDSGWKNSHSDGSARKHQRPVNDHGRARLTIPEVGTYHQPSTWPLADDTSKGDASHENTFSVNSMVQEKD